MYQKAWRLLNIYLYGNFSAITITYNYSTTEKHNLKLQDGAIEKCKTDTLLLNKAKTHVLQRSQAYNFKDRTSCNSH